MLVPDASPDPPIIIMEDPPYFHGIWRGNVGLDRGSSLFTVMEDPPYFHLDFMVDPPYFHGTRRGIWDSDLCYFFSHERLLGGTWRRPTGWRILLIFTPYLQSYRFLLHLSKGSLLRFQCSCLAYLHLLPLRSSTDFYE